MQSGFTLVEVLLSVAILALLASLSAPVFQSFQVKNDGQTAHMLVVQSLRRSQALAQGVKGDSPWGVYVQTGSVTLFKGISYGSRDAAYDEVSGISPTIGVSGLQEIVFEKMTGNPQSTGTVMLSPGGDTLTVNINEKGTLSYE